MRHIERNGQAFLAMHLHALRKLVTKQSDELFEEAKVCVPSHSVSVVLYLQQEKWASITDLSDKLGYSHQLINQRLSILEQMSLIEKKTDPRDRRKSRIVLSRSGQAQAKKLIALLPAAAQAFETLSAELGVDLVAVLKEAHQLLELRSLAHRADTSSKANLAG